MTMGWVKRSNIKFLRGHGDFRWRLRILVFLLLKKSILKKKKHQKTKSMQNYPACQELYGVTAAYSVRASNIYETAPFEL